MNEHYSVSKSYMPFKTACERLGVPFGCENGICQSCRIEVIEGMENLTGMTTEEKDFELEYNVRLACQCKLIKDEVKFKF